MACRLHGYPTVWLPCGVSSVSKIVYLCQAGLASQNKVSRGQKHKVDLFREALDPKLKRAGVAATTLGSVPGSTGQRVRGEKSEQAGGHRAGHQQKVLCSPPVTEDLGLRGGHCPGLSPVLHGGCPSGPCPCPRAPPRPHLPLVPWITSSAWRQNQALCLLIHLWWGACAPQTLSTDCGSPARPLQPGRWPLVTL